MEWIKIEDRKPPNSVYILVALYDSRPKVEMHFIRIAFRLNEQWYDDHDQDSILGKCQYVTHWMPLPDKPEK